ncbi:DNA cytosine methyltransferase [Elizabethkingia anophelis]|uniref:DNA cytosine methyltransferase n=1 Tax=Elizabethkingia anophelis TaxID=1117645 RepID=UPI0020B32728|nr:DNA cytosine methyltransferase [Elizabethkingia anophelis]MDV3956692.1 DNA (cytosine-5-)-methyltransferase [Elizabethkingia anophelis]UTF92778.1 DNA cytosine methyltransferase [Elizabethkingia anophelis]
MIPIIDVFAGPGGLGEGFSSLIDENEERVFKIKLSIEKDPYAHQTLKLRSFFREFDANQVPEDYYEFVRGDIDLDELYRRFPEQLFSANLEACCGTLGEPDEGDTNALTNEEVDNRIQNALEGRSNWVLIGGPPCQAYSLVGRSRRQEKILDEAKDKRVGLYKEYLRIIAVHQPAVFVMENVKGILSAKTEDNQIFSKILDDLSDPVAACISEKEIIDNNQDHIKYRIYSLTKFPEAYDLYGNPVLKPIDFIIKSEEYGVPQKRHRVILLGVREDIPAPEQILEKSDEIPLSSVIGNLPEIRSGITRSFTHFTMESDEEGKLKKRRHYEKVNDCFEEWAAYMEEFNNQITDVLGVETEQLILPETLGEEFIPVENYDLPTGHPLSNWYSDNNLNGILHHVSRKHLLQDIKRYMFASRYAELHGSFPRLEDYRNAGDDLMPDHENAESGKFTDRFRVQLPDIPATTVTSHISKDGHYFIHYDPQQSRSFTVREAARVQTFPDNYYFCGGRTQQFHQVGNAVPPYLAYQIAQIVKNIVPDEVE